MRLYPAGQRGAGPAQQYKRAVESVADTTFGRQAHTAARFPKTMPTIEAMDATSVQMPVPEMYTGLSTGTIDATTLALELEAIQADDESRGICNARANHDAINGNRQPN